MEERFPMNLQSFHHAPRWSLPASLLLALILTGCASTSLKSDEERTPVQAAPASVLDNDKK
jgi:hypothetical protein